ncbi:MAG: 16S rRNA (cytosine(967)-C(5))-methyltransferase RsmB [Firmicutes bacterium]|nr:16S rRNA (cytosine(967)-C(5))-methyltransferase RsmB [Bacillota bacterium]
MKNRNPNPRKLAAEVVFEVAEAKAYADIALDRAVRRRTLTAQDRAFLTELVYGPIKYLRYLDYILSQFSQRPIDKLDPKLRSYARIGLYQIFLLDHIPDPVAVYETVEAAKGDLHKGAIGYLNGLLRSASRQKENITWPAGNEYLGTIHSHPQWLVERWIALWGREAAEALCKANNAIPPLTLRVNTLKTTRESLLTRLESLGIKAAPATLSPVGIKLLQGTSIPELTPLAEGHCQVQDIGSMLVSELLAPERGDFVLDACSAPGGKTTHLAQLMEDEGTIVAADVNPSRLRMVEENAERLGITCIQTQVQDAAFLHERDQWLEAFDKVLVDAPCTGTGVLRRRADSRWRKSESDLVELPRLQKAILASSALTVKPGGVLVYSTCSIDPAENQEVVEWFLSQNPGWEVEDFRSFLKLPADYGTYLAGSVNTRPEFLFLYSHREKTDGFFAARLRKRG